MIAATAVLLVATTDTLADMLAMIYDWLFLLLPQSFHMIGATYTTLLVLAVPVIVALATYTTLLAVPEPPCHPQPPEYPITIITINCSC